MGGTAAATLQMLLPRVMWMIDQASSFREKPAERGHQTGLYFQSIIFGDVEAAERAGALLRHLHRTKVALDPVTGEQFPVDSQDLLIWVHNTLNWCTIRGCDLLGPKVSPAQRDQFLKEQCIAARLVGIEPPEAVPATWGELDAYIEQMTPRLAFVPPTEWFRDIFFPRFPKPSKEDLMAWAVGRLLASLLAPVHRQLYGFRGHVLDGVVTAGTAKMLSNAAARVSYEELLGGLRHSAVNNDWARFNGPGTEHLGRAAPVG
jgi:uncharacterized protein (DUF2236 family)